MMTGLDDVESVDGAYEAGATDIVQEVTDRRQAEEKIRRLACFDTVTGLPNRAWLLERLDMMIAHARRREETMSVMFMDLDQFKRINDTPGHSAGDAMLSEAAARIGRCVRREDVVGRAGAGGSSASIGIAVYPHDGSDGPASSRPPTRRCTTRRTRAATRSGSSAAT